MLCLAIDTAGTFCSVALAGNKQSLAKTSEDIGRGHAERLMPMIDSVLTAAGKSFNDLDRIGVATGPGSFTGVRIGISAARGLALALEVPAVGIGVLDILIEQAIRLARTREDQMPENGIVVAILSAARGNLFVKAVQGSPGAFEDNEALLPAANLTIDEARRWIDSQIGPLLLIGPGVAALGREGSVSAGAFASANHVDCDVLAEMVLRGEGTSPPRPIYLRPADARPQIGKAVAHA